uniref:Cytosolic phospholipase A2 zeta n=1 Tax=Lygus hesperus TaxID=30085 RepID=A0A0A9X840_LYGHE
MQSPDVKYDTPYRAASNNSFGDAGIKCYGINTDTVTHTYPAIMQTNELTDECSKPMISNDNNDKNFQPVLSLFPSNWRAVFSQEYQQTYYVHRDPASGAETSSWTLPYS